MDPEVATAVEHGTNFVIVETIVVVPNEVTVVVAVTGP